MKISHPKWLESVLDFIWFLLAFCFVANLISGNAAEVLSIFDWSTPGNAGNAFAQALFLVGVIMTIRTFLKAFKKKEHIQ